MTRGLSWKHGYRWCEGTNSKGQPCGNKVPTGVRCCYAHRGKRKSR